MKVLMIGLVFAASCAAFPAAAQDWLGPSHQWLDPDFVLHHSFVEVEGGGVFQGRTKADISVAGLGTTNQSTSQSHDFFGGVLAGVQLNRLISIEGEGVYSRNHLNIAPANPVLGIGGAVRTYGGFANLKLTAPPRYSVRIMNFAITPYAAAGVGGGEVRYTGRNGAFSYNSYDNGFMWQAKAGVEVRMGPHLALDLAYRYMQSPRGNFIENANYTAAIHSHEQVATAGLKFYF